LYHLRAPIVSINKNILQAEPVADECDIIIDNNNEISVSYASKVKEGTLAIILFDENYKVIKEFPSNKEEEQRISLETGKYHIRVESDFFKGSYQVYVYK